MKIAMIGHKRIPSREGGVEIVVEQLSKGLLSSETMLPPTIAAAAMFRAANFRTKHLMNFAELKSKLLKLRKARH